MPPRRRRARTAKSTPGAAPTFDCVTGFLAPPMLENLLPVMTIDDIGRLAQSSTQMKSIMATAEASACVLRALGPIKEILGRARALVTGEATSHDVWLWDPPPGNPACGDRGLNASWEDRGEPIEYDRSGLNGAWVRNLVSFLEGSPERVVGPQYDEDDYEDEHVRRGSSRLASANSRPGILKRIKALEETAPLQIYKGVRKILHVLIQGFGFSGQKLAGGTSFASASTVCCLWSSTRALKWPLLLWRLVVANVAVVRRDAPCRQWWFSWRSTTKSH